MKADEVLIIQVLNKATGADIHTVKNVIGYYRGCFDLMNNPKSDQSYWKDKSQQAETKLRKYLTTGEIDLP